MKSMQIEVRYGDRTVLDTGNILWSPDTRKASYLIISREIDIEEVRFAVDKLIEKLQKDDSHEQKTG